MVAYREKLASVEPSAAVKQAARFLVTGAAKNMKEASEAAGLHPNYLGMLVNSGNPKLLEYMTMLESQIEDSSVDMSKILMTLGRRAVRNLAYMAEMAESEAIRFKANQDLADRSPETSKTQKVAVASLTLDGEDARHIAAAMVEAANVRRQFAQQVTDGFVRVEDSNGRQSAQAGEAGISPEAGTQEKVRTDA